MKENEFGAITENVEDRQHNLEMQIIMANYENSVDKDIYNFVKDIIHGREVLPLTVGYLSDAQRYRIMLELPERTPMFAPRCIIDADAVRHIITRHGEKGTADHSMSDIKDIARMAYVFANFDEAVFEGNYSRKKFKLANGSPAPHITLKKRIDGIYYIIEAVSDGKTNKSHIVSAFIGH